MIETFLPFIIASVTVGLWTIIGFRKNLAGLIVTIPIIFGTIAYTYETYTKILGHPTAQELPEKFTLIYGVAKEPEAIYLWIIEESTQTPRAYVLPYSKDAHKALDRARRRMKEGKTIRSKRIKTQEGEPSFRNDRQEVSPDLPPKIDSDPMVIYDSGG
jgi:hypothetical protein|tara:strand:+ start:4939 stop:5415 length:477 start_codon:yes stop_codon:yes gene_type:complete